MTGPPWLRPALIQLLTADELESAGRHDEAVTFAANAVTGDHDPDFDVHTFLFGARKREVSKEPTGREQPGKPSTKEVEATTVEP